MSWVTLLSESLPIESHIKLDVGDDGEVEWISAEVVTTLTRGRETKKQPHQDHEVKLWRAMPLLGKFRDTKP